MQLFLPVEMSTNLGVMVVVVALLGQVLDFRDVGMFSNVCSPLNGNTTTTYGGGNILHKLQLWNVPVVDQVTSFPPSHTCCKDGILVLVEIGKGVFQLIKVVFIHGIGLGMIMKVHEGPQCNNEV